MDLVNGFSNPWEHARLLSDAARNDALLQVLSDRAEGLRVLEVGCGTGLLSCIAARMGAKRVIGVEPTPMADVAEELVRSNGLSEIVEIRRGLIEDLEPEPVDLAFSELLNADPFLEGVVPAMRAARAWTPLLVPRRLKVCVALARAGDSAREVGMARDEVARFARRWDLRLGPLDELLDVREPYRYFSHAERPVSTAGVAWDIALGEDEEPEDEVEITVRVEEPGPVAGAVVWFEAELDDGVIMANRPGRAGHWGNLICSWAEERGMRAGQQVRLRVENDGDQVEVRRV